MSVSFVKKTSKKKALKKALPKGSLIQPGKATKHYVKGKVVVTDKKTGVETKEEENVKSLVTTRPTANVGVRLGATRNLGDYNSVRVEVSLYIPVEVDENFNVLEETLDKAFSDAQGWVEGKVTEMVDQLESA